MNLTDYYLRFPNEQSSFAVALALDAVTITEDGPRLVRYTHRYALDVIGEIIVDETPIPGWHVNFRILDGSPPPEQIIPYVVEVDNPIRVWA